MLEKTVSVELTRNQLQYLWDNCDLTVIDSLTNAIDAALAQFAATRDREAKVRALYDWTEDSGPSAMEDSERTLSRLNAAGWDLVRMEKK
jgi:hypothetical protein